MRDEPDIPAGDVASPDAGEAGLPAVTDLGRDPISPLDLLDEHFEREEERLRARRREVRAARELVARLAALPQSGERRSVEPLSDEMAPAAVGRLMRDATGVARSLVMVLDAGPALDTATLRQNEAWIALGNEQRTIYPASALESPAARQWMREWSGIGERQRIAEAPATEFAVFGDDAAIGFLRWGDPSGGYAIYRDPIIVFGLKEYFDLAWRHSTPVPSEVDADSLDQRIVELLGDGLKDEAIARQTGASLRTVRRRIAAMMADSGVQTRFQLGAILGRR